MDGATETQHEREPDALGRLAGTIRQGRTAGTVSERAGWPMDRCAECHKPETNGTDIHPPLCDDWP